MGLLESVCHANGRRLPECRLAPEPAEGFEPSPTDKELATVLRLRANLGGQVPVFPGCQQLFTTAPENF